MDERQRRALHGKLEGALGLEEAATMMDLLPPSGWNDVARTHHIDQLRSELRGEFAELRGEFGELRGEFGELRGEFGELRGEVRGELGKIHHELGLLHRDFGMFQATVAKLTWTMTMGVIGALVAMAGLAFTAATLV